MMPAFYPAIALITNRQLTMVNSQYIPYYPGVKIKDFNVLAALLLSLWSSDFVAKVWRRMVG
jgi:hypothetical protein